MPLNTKTHSELVTDQVAGWAAALKISPSLKPGDPARAIFETNATQQQAIQATIVAVFAFSRAATCNGADLDSFYNEFGFYRLPGEPASGEVTFSLNEVHDEEVIVPVGTIVQTVAGDILFEVVKDTGMAAWDPSRSAYVIPPDQLQINVRVVSTATGADQNVLANQLTVFTSSVSGPDKVTNLQPFTNGTDQEEDADYRVRFIPWINSRRLGTVDALISAVLELKTKVTVAVIENYDINGTPVKGLVTVIVDDGTGDPPQSLIDEAQAACEKVRAAGIQVRVYGPTKVMAVIGLTLTIDPDFDDDEVKAAVKAAVINYVNTLKMGETLYLSSIIPVVKAVEGVISIRPSSLVINSIEDDLEVESVEVIKTVTVTVGGS